MSYVDFQGRLERGETVLLDGGTGTEVLLRFPSPAGPWAVSPLLNAPDVLREIHETYIGAGADIITTATFRTHARATEQAGLSQDAATLTRKAVELAREARARTRSDSHVLVAGSMAPLEDCYEPSRVPDDADLAAEHEVHARNLAEAGVDFLLAETMNTVREARAALLAGLQTGLPTWISLTCGRGAKLLSGESLKEAMDALLPLAPSALLVNCTAPDLTTTALEALKGLHTVPLGAYANNGHPTDENGWAFSSDYPPARYVEVARGWIERGARIVGGCCGTTPEHIRALREELNR